MFVVLICGSLLGYLVAHFSTAWAYALRGLVRVPASIPALFLSLLFIGMGAPLWLGAGIAASPLAFGKAFTRARALNGSAHAEFARATGVPETMLLRRDLAHELRTNGLSEAARAFAEVTIVVATVSFLGFGARPPHRDLGLMIAASRETLLAAWWTALFPALVLVLLIFFARLTAGIGDRK
jgi:peptide/nickel transport system permease protein